MSSREILERCFLPLNRRTPPTPCFLRIIGQTEGSSDLITRYGQLSGPSGACFQDGIPNPGEAEISRFYAAVGQQFPLTQSAIQRHMTLWLGQLRPEGRQLLSDAVAQALELLRTRGSNENILKNTYIKFMCWLRGPFGKVLSGLGRAEPPKILFQGNISKYEVLILHVLHQAGCDVWYVHNSEAPYLKADPDGRFSRLIQGKTAPQPPPGTRTAVGSAPRVRTAPGSQTRPPASARPSPGAPPAPRPPQPPPPSGPDPWETAQGAAVNSWMAGVTAWEAALLPAEQRGTGAASRRHSVLSACLGVDERSVYRNRLFALKQSLKGSGRNFVLLEEKPSAPSAAQTAPFMAVNRRASRSELFRSLARCMNPACPKADALMAQRAFVQAMERHPEQDPVRCFNHGVRLACWLTEFAQRLFPKSGAKQPPALVCYGPASEGELTLLWTLAQMGADVLWFCSDKEAGAVFSRHFLASDWQKTIFDNSLPHEPFPQREERVRAGTTAYNASRELDELLHSDTGMFRDRQFVRSQPVTLRTTYDEVEQLWREQAQYRPSFQTRDGVVYVPNLFVKISGVDRGDLDQYWDHIRSLRTEETYLVTQTPFLQNAPAMSAAQAGAFLHNGRLDPNALKASRFYKYDYLPDDTQDYILEKIQALIDYDLVIGGGPDLPARILAVLADLDKELLRLLQRFDFTRTIPKFLAVDVTEKLYSLEECVLLAFLNLTGFDIAVFTPTGYRNLEKHLRGDSFDTLTAGPFQFDLTVPNLNKNPGRSWFPKLFRGG